MTIKTLWYTMVLILVTVVTATAEEVENPGAQSVTASVPEDDHNIGFFYTALGSPYPALLGFGLAFGIVESFRLELAMGTADLTAEIPTIGVGMKYALLNKKISPVLGLHVSSGKEESERRDLSYRCYACSPADRRGVFAHFTVGFDIQIEEGLLLTMGTSWGLTKRSGRKEILGLEIQNPLQLDQYS